MRFYVTPAGEWFTDKAAAGKTARSMDVPTDKQGLRAFFNVHHVAATRPFEPDLLNQDVPEHEVHNTGSSFDTPPAELGERYRSPLSAASTIAGIDAGMCAAAVRQMDGTNLAKIVAASIERLAQLNTKGASA